MRRFRARRLTPLARQHSDEARREAGIERRLHRLLLKHGAETLADLRGAAATEGYALLRQAPNAYMRCLFKRAAQNPQRICRLYVDNSVTVSYK